MWCAVAGGRRWHASFKRIRETVAFMYILNLVCLGDLCVKEMNNQEVNSNKLNICKKLNLKWHFLFSSCCTFGHTLGHCPEKNLLVIPKGNSQKAFPALLFALIFCWYLYNNLFIWCIQTWEVKLLGLACEVNLSASGQQESGNPELCSFFLTPLFLCLLPYRTLQIWKQYFLITQMMPRSSAAFIYLFTWILANRTWKGFRGAWWKNNNNWKIPGT